AVLVWVTWYLPVRSKLSLPLAGSKANPDPAERPVMVWSIDTGPERDTMSFSDPPPPNWARVAVRLYCSSRSSWSDSETSPARPGRAGGGLNLRRVRAGAGGGLAHVLGPVVGRDFVRRFGLVAELVVDLEVGLQGGRGERPVGADRPALGGLDGHRAAVGPGV